MEALAGTTVGGLLVKDLALDQVGAFWAHIQENRDQYVDVIPFVSRTPDVGALAERVGANLARQAQGLGEFYTLWDDDRMAGYVLVREKELEARWAEIGYMLGRPWQGRGITTTLCRRLIDRLFAQGMEKIVIACNDDNIASLAVAKKLGFTLEGVLRNHFVVNGRVRSLASLGLLKSEWWEA